MEVNRIYCGDNLEIMREFFDECVDLIYLDPPFFSNKNYEVIWGDKEEVRSFEDRWEGGRKHYVGWMVERLKEMHRILKPTGSIYLHCDWHASHYLKIEMDKIFGDNNFQNEIIWCYRTGGATKKRFSRKHDSIFFYSKSNDFKYNCIKERIYYQKPFINTSKDDKGRYYADVLPVDFWEIPAVINVSKERLGYPTQKPEALLERIIKASSNEGDIVLDPFCGCGTSVAVAKRLSRKFIGIDISPIACRLIAKRISYSEFDIIGLPMTIDDLKKMQPHEFQQWVCDKMLARNTSSSKTKPSGGDRGIDGILLSNLLTGKYAGSPLQVKQSENVGVNVIKNFFASMHDMKAKKGSIVAISFGSGAIEQVAKYKLDDNIEIRLIRAEDLCKVKCYNYDMQ